MKQKNLNLPEQESKFAHLLWENVPLTTSELIKLAESTLEWKRTTTYTVLKNLSKKGLFENQEGTVIALMTKEEFYAKQGEETIKTGFSGSLPNFIMAFNKQKKLTAEEIDSLQHFIDSYKEEDT